MEPAHYRELRKILMSSLDERGELSDEEIRSIIDDLVLGFSHENYLTVSERNTLSRELFSSVRKLDILQELIDDKDVTEIMVNGPERIYVEKNGQMRLWERTFSSREKLEDVVQQIVGNCNRVVNERKPIVDARLSNGARVNAVISPIALDGPILTIRRFPDTPITMEKLIAIGSISEEASHFLQKLVEAGYSIIISGGTSAGKTTFLNALSNYIPKNERIITIEDNAELQIQGIDNLVRLEAKSANMEGNENITIRDLIKSSLRMRPDRVIVGEVRGGEAVDMLQAFNTGHLGFPSCLHYFHQRNHCYYVALLRLHVLI
jgi:pilus assembly protein CpaF